MELKIKTLLSVLVVVSMIYFDLAIRELTGFDATAIVAPMATMMVFHAALSALRSRKARLTSTTV